MCHIGYSEHRIDGLVKNTTDLYRLSCEAATEAVANGLGAGGNIIEDVQMQQSYFFKYTLPSDGRIEAYYVQATEGTLNLYTDCSAEPVISNPYESMESDVYPAGTTLYLEWIFGTNEGALDPTIVEWDLRFTSFESEDPINSNCEDATEAVANGLGAGGNIIEDVQMQQSYFFKYTLPSDGKIEAYYVQATEGTLNLYSDCNAEPVISNPYESMESDVYPAGTTLYLEWIFGTNEGALDPTIVEWDLSFTSSEYFPPTGLSCEEKIEAQVGTNTITDAKGDSPYYYRYVMQNDASVTVSMDSKTTLQSSVILESCESSPSFYLDSSNDYTSDPIKAGTEIFIVVYFLGDEPSLDWELSLNEPDQVISFESLDAKIYGDSDFLLNAVSSENLDVSYTSSNSEVAEIEGNILKIVGVGTSIITAYQQGNETISAAVPVSRELEISKKSQIVNFTSFGEVIYGDSNFMLNAESSENLEISYTSSNSEVAEIEGNMLKIVGVGSSTITAYQYGNDTVFTADPISRELEISKRSQSISLIEFSTIAYSDTVIVLQRKTSAGLPITYESSNSNVAAIHENSIKIKGAGVSTILAFQEGDSNTLAAPSLEQDLRVDKADQKISIQEIPDKSIGSDPFNVKAYSSSELELDYSVDGPASIDDSTIVLSGAVGVVTVTTIQAGNNNYNSAEAKVSFEVFDQCQDLKFVISGIESVKCQGDSTGSVLLNIEGGSSPFTFLLNEQSIVEEDLLRLPAGDYSLTISDSNSCEKNKLFTIEQPESLVITGIITESSSPEGNGSIIANVEGGTSPYQFKWSTGAEGSEIYDLTADTYTLVVTDAQGCTKTETLEVGSITGMSNPVKKSINIYPNPTSNIVYLETHENVLKVKLFNSFGQRIDLQASMNKLSNNLLVLDTNFLQPGIYFINVSGEMHRLIIEK
ncbi:T9SS type A sorting domain-containing protein [Marivirga sericea]|nr:T9SS type A sorting domain-containing protein [Marivirga sericea]